MLYCTVTLVDTVIEPFEFDHMSIVPFTDTDDIVIILFKHGTKLYQFNRSEILSLIIF